MDVYLQIIPLLSLVAYFIYLIYYYAAPMFWLKVMLFYAHFRYRDIDIRFSGGKISVKYEISGEECLVERMLETDPTSRFFAMSVCSEFKQLLREIRTGKPTEKENAHGLSTGKETRGTGRQRTEEDCD